MTQQTATSIPGVRRRRLQRGLTMLELAQQCTTAGAPVSEGQVSRIETGVHFPRPRLRAVLSELLDLDENLHLPREREAALG